MSDDSTQIQPLFNPNHDEWVIMTGRYILNMGAAEFATRLLIARIEGTDASTIYSADFARRISFLRKRFPRGDTARHKWAMKAFEVAGKHTVFRNIVAHSPNLITSLPDGSYKIEGIMELTPKAPEKMAELVSFSELKTRVDESAIIARQMLEMQADFPISE